MTQTGLIVMPPDMNLRDAGLLLRAAAVTGAPVIEDGRLVGVVSRNDLLTGLLSIPLDAKQAEFESEIARLQALPTHTLTYLFTSILPELNEPQAIFPNSPTYCCRRCPCGSS